MTFSAADLARLRAMARRFDAEEVRYRKYVANAGYGATVNSEQMARDAAADARTIRRVLRQIDPLIEGPRQTLAAIAGAAE
jgi:hypothetical protein